ncbi:MAG TPA: hypothetical protein VIO37_13720 [Candidatus Dormibacteraeota bacterium]
MERSIKDGQKTLKAAIDQLQVQVRKTAKQADVDKALKRLEGLRKQVQQIARSAATGTPARSTRRAATTTKSSTKKAPARRSKPATRKTPAAARPASSSAVKAAPKRARRASTRRSATSATPAAPAPEPETMSEFDRGGYSS